MRCKECSGTGRVTVVTTTHLLLSWQQCPDCGGCGITHCCEGDQSQTRPPGKIRHPSTSDVVYADEEREFIQRCDEYRRKYGLRFLSARHYLAIAHSLGYRRAGPGESTPPPPQLTSGGPR